jgi:hypothetical protein
MVQIDANAPSVVCSGNDIPCCTTVTQDDIDDFSVAATLKQSNVTIKVCDILDIPYFIYVVDKICALQNNPNDMLINFLIFQRCRYIMCYMQRKPRVMHITTPASTTPSKKSKVRYT